MTDIFYVSITTSVFRFLTVVMKTDKDVKVWAYAPVMAPPTKAKPRDEAKAAA